MAKKINSVDGNLGDYDGLLKLEAIAPPARGNARSGRVYDGVRIGRHPKHGAKTPRGKTAHRGRIRD